ncbi:hypothetical protein Z043_106272, partial [Scleropages formosus]
VPLLVLSTGEVFAQSHFAGARTSPETSQRSLQTMQGLGTLWFSVLPALLTASSLFIEGDRDPSKICEPPPQWEIDGRAPMQEHLGNVVVAANMGVLRNKLLRYGLRNVSYLIVNQQDISSRRQYQELKRRAPKEIPVYQQAPRQQNVWKLLNGAKDDFLIYDRCGRLTFHIVLPYTFLQYPYVEAAIWVSYRKDICGNCSVSDAAH